MAGKEEDKVDRIMKQDADKNSTGSVVLMQLRFGALQDDPLSRAREKVTPDPEGYGIGEIEAC